MSKHIVLFPGSFNPMHIGHLCLANYIVETTPTIDEIWVLVTPTNPFKTHTTLLPEDFRVRWARHHVRRHPRLKVSTVELSLPRPSYTIRTLDHLRTLYPTYDFTLLIGMDSLETLPQWHEGSRLMQQERILVYPRLGAKVPEHLQPLPPNITILDAPIFEVSATRIRQMVRSGHHLPYFLDLDSDHPLYTELQTLLSQQTDQQPPHPL